MEKPCNDCGAYHITCKTQWRQCDAQALMISTGNGSLLFTGDLTEDRTSLMKLYFLLRFAQLTGQHLTLAMDNDI